MKVLVSDGRLLKQTGRLQLVKLRGQWHVVGEKYMCMVNSYDEGVQVIERLRAEGAH